MAEFESDDSWEVPSYMIGAANHSMANLNETWENELSVAEKVGYFVKASALSGINGFYNTAVWAGNLFSEDEAVYRDTREYMAELDEDLGKYYDANRTATDLAGFIVSSFVPGLGGVKVLNAGAKVLAAANEGRVGVNMANALGIIPGSRDALVKAAIAEASTSSRAFSMANASTARAVAAGFGEQAVQALAFETAVAITMHKNPILDSMSTGDLITNIFTGAALGGAIGGVLNTATTAYKIRGAIKNVDNLTQDVTQLRTGVAGTSASDDLLIIRNDMEHTRRNAVDGVDQSTWDELVERKMQQADNEMRKRVTALTGGDDSLGGLIYQGVANDPLSRLVEKFYGLVEIANLPKVGQLIKKWTSEMIEGTETPTHAIRYLRTWGDDMGKISDDMPVQYLTDKLAKGETVTVRGTSIKVGSKESYKVKLGEVFKPSLDNLRESMARIQWAYSPHAAPLKVPSGQNYLDVGINDVAVLTKAHREGFTSLRLVDDKGAPVGTITSTTDLLAAVKNAKVRLSQEMSEKMLKAGNLPEESIDKIVYATDTPAGFITGAQVANNTEDSLFYLRNAQRDYYNKVHANTPNPPPIEEVRPWERPQNYAMVYNMEKLAPVNNFEIEALAKIAADQKLRQVDYDMAVANAFGKDADLLPSMSDKTIGQFDRTGAGPGFISYANGGYGTAQSFFEFVGKWTNSQKIKANETISNTFNNVANSLKQSPEAVTRLATIMQKVRNSGEHYVMNPEGTGLILRKLAQGGDDALENIEGLNIRKGVDLEISFGTGEAAELVAEFVETHISTNAARLRRQNMMRHSQGMYDDFDPSTFYPPQPNPSRFKYHAFVVDDKSITSTYHSTMLYATDAGTLERQIAEARAQGFRVVTKAETEEYYKARGQYEYSKGINENLIDSRLRREGTSAPMFPITGSPTEMVDDILSWHIKKEHGLIMEGVELKYSNEFGILRRMGEQYTQLATSSRLPSIFAKRQVKNPFQEYIDLALDKPQSDRYQAWTTVNQTIKEVGDRVHAAVSNIVKGAKTPYDLENVNKVFEEYGLKVAATPAMMQAWTNHPAGADVVTKIIRSQNSMLSALILRLDPINALNNALGSNVLLGAETAAVTRAIQNGSEAGAGELAQLLKIGVPGVEDAVSSPTKLIANAYQNFFKNHDALVKRYEGLGIDVNLAKQFKLMVDDLAIVGNETPKELMSKMDKAFTKFNAIADKGEKWTGNRLAESMNRYVTANVMDQITSVAVKHGVIDQKIANTYINTFVNRVQGNLLANQRPQIFTGPVGQAIGLFQSYQFNIMQQLLRHVGEGRAKDALTLLGLQSTIYGMNGLPGFQAINTHIVGTASGNTNHTDLYKATYDTVGKNVGDWLTYGLSSNMFIHPDLKINLYSRGDINPRSLTVVPTSLPEVPIVGAYAKFTSGIKSSLETVARGGDVWNTFLTGIEQSSINRPLAGLARVARGVESGVVFSQSGQGNIVAANDLNSLVNLARLSGAKPFDEAVATDAAFRVQAYSKKDALERSKLGKAVRSIVTGGGTPTQEDMETFQENYVKIGGKQEEFTRWYLQQLKAATTPQANKIVENQKKSQYSEYMSAIMGGRVFKTPADWMAETQAQETQ